LNRQSRTARRGATAPVVRSNPAPPEPAEGVPSAGAPPAPFLGDPAAVDRWLEATRAAALDLLAAAREGARRPHKRVLSRAELRRQARDAFAQVTSLLDHAAEALRRGS
jgi:hypothetical protein